MTKKDNPATLGKSIKRTRRTKALGRIQIPALVFALSLLVGILFPSLSVRAESDIIEDITTPETQLLVTDTPETAMTETMMGEPTDTETTLPPLIPESFFHIEGNGKVEDNPIPDAGSTQDILPLAEGSHLTKGANGIIKEPVPGLSINTSLPAEIVEGDGAREGLLLLGFRGVTIHETSNWSPGANAQMHAIYLRNGGKYNEVSWHYAVDSQSIYQSVPEYERAWHAGDTGVGVGNAQTIAIEQCVNPEGDFDQTMANAQWLAADILYRHGIFTVEGHLFQHYDFSAYKKNCPMTIRDKGLWPLFCQRVQVYLDRMIAEKGKFTVIRQSTTATIDQAKIWAKDNNATSTFIDLADLYWAAAQEAGIDPVVCYAQAAYETAFGQFGGVINASYCNPAGMKIKNTGSDKDPKNYVKFASWKDGVQAHIDHLALLAGAPQYPKKSSLDPNHITDLYLAAAGVEHLSGQWSASLAYHTPILNHMKNIQKTGTIQGTVTSFEIIGKENNQYVVDITMKNNGTITWSDKNKIKLGYGVKSTGESFVSFTDSAIVKPGASYKFRIFLSPATGGYIPSAVLYQLVYRESIYTAEPMALVLQSEARINNAVISKIDAPKDILRHQKKIVKVTVKNTGDTAWSDADNYRLLFSGHALKDIACPLPTGTVVLPGKSYTFNVEISGNAKNMQIDTWTFQMDQEYIGSFGAIKTVDVKTVTPSKAQIVSIIPKELGNQNVQFTITVKNTGTDVWERDAKIRLGVVSLQNLTGANRVDLPAKLQIAPGETGVFVYNTKMNASGNIGITVQMLQENVLFFGDKKSTTITYHDSKITKIEMPTSLLRAQDFQAKVTVKNTGFATWSESTQFRLGIVSNLQSINRVHLPKGMIVEPGKEYTFLVPLKASSTLSGETLSFRMVQEMICWFGEKKEVSYATVLPTQARVDSIEVSSVNNNTIRLAIQVTNTDTISWTREMRIRLGITELVNLSGKNRVDIPTNQIVKPGESIVLYYDVQKTGAQPGKISVRMLLENVTFFGNSLTTTIPQQQARITKIESPPDFLRNQQHTIFVTVKNTGTSPWSAATGYRLGITGERVLKNRSYLPTGTTILPGESYSFPVTISANPAKVSSELIYFQMLQENVRWFGETQSYRVNTVLPVKAEISSMTIESSRTDPSKRTLYITVKNTGSVVWDKSSLIRLGITDRQNLNGAGRVYLPDSACVKPGESYTFTYNVQLTSAAPGYVQVRMLQENITFFGDEKRLSVH